MLAGKITSSTAGGGTKLGYGDNAVIDADSLLIKFTYAGDTNLDGTVTIADLGELATHWQSTTAVWRHGDFNYDGSVTIADLGDLASNWQAGVGSPLGMSFDEALAAVGLGGVAVPSGCSRPSWRLRLCYVVSGCGLAGDSIADLDAVATNWHRSMPCGPWVISTTTDSSPSVTSAIWRATGKPARAVRSA